MLDYEITAKDLAERLKSSTELKVVDVREPWEYETAHIAGTILMPMGDVPSRANAELDPDEAVVILCHAGVRSMNVTAWLRNQGFEKAQSLRGGIDAWSREIDPSVPRY
jgi:rhodanese-related sulfurtransferase